jgi:hypothetical protein
MDGCLDFMRYIYIYIYVIGWMRSRDWSGRDVMFGNSKLVSAQKPLAALQVGDGCIYGTPYHYREHVTKLSPIVFCLHIDPLKTGHSHTSQVIFTHHLAQSPKAEHLFGIYLGIFLFYLRYLIIYFYLTAPMKTIYNFCCFTERHLCNHKIVSESCEPLY